MALYLVQHGKSLPKDVDPEKGLSKEGIAEVERIAEVAKGYGVSVSRVKHSGKKRARRTAEIFAEALAPEGAVVEAGGLKPLDDVSAVAGALDSRENLMLVGHLPFMSRLTSYLIVGSIDAPIFKFQNGGIVCLDREPNDGSWFIKWTISPNIG